MVPVLTLLTKGGIGRSLRRLGHVTEIRPSGCAVSLPTDSGQPALFSPCVDLQVGADRVGDFQRPRQVGVTNDQVAVGQ
jgi:hypothetical protein